MKTSSHFYKHVLHIYFTIFFSNSMGNQSKKNLPSSVLGDISETLLSVGMYTTQIAKHHRQEKSGIAAVIFSPPPSSCNCRTDNWLLFPLQERRHRLSIILSSFSSSFHRARGDNFTILFPPKKIGEEERNEDRNLFGQLPSKKSRNLPWDANFFRAGSLLWSLTTYVCSLFQKSMKNNPHPPWRRLQTRLCRILNVFSFFLKKSATDQKRLAAHKNCCWGEGQQQQQYRPLSSLACSPGTGFGELTSYFRHKRNISTRRTNRKF